MKNLPTVSVIIPNFNGERFLRRCLDSVLKTNYPSYEVILVDGGSTDRSLFLVDSFYSESNHLLVVRENHNSGVAAARNLGTRKAKGSILVHLDNDAEVHPDWLNGLIEVMEDSTVGIAQSKMILEDRVHISCAGELIIPYVGWIVLLGTGETSQKYSEVREICATSGSMAVRRDVIEHMGLFDSKIPLSFEDVDFSLRAWLSGYKVVLAPTSIVYHNALAKGTDPQRRMRVEYCSHRNSVRMLLKNFETATLARYLPVSIIAMTFRALLGLAKGEHYPFLGLIRGLAWNIANSKDTLSQRRRIQRSVRRIRDKDFLWRISVQFRPLQIYELLKKGRGF